MNGPTIDDVNAMSDIMGALDDVDSGRMTQQLENALAQNNPQMVPEGMQDVAAMKGILSDLYDVAGDDLNTQPTQHEAQKALKPVQIQEAPQDMSYEEWLAYSNGQGLQNADPNTGQQIQQPQVQTNNYIQAENEWMIVSEQFQGVKSVQKHTIKSNVTGKAIISDIALKESARAICNMLNQGVSINDTRVLGILSSGMRYTNLIESMVSTLRTKKQVVKESNYDKAKECDSKLVEQKAEAQTIKNDVVDYMNRKNINYK